MRFDRILPMKKPQQRGWCPLISYGFGLLVFCISSTAQGQQPAPMPYVQQPAYSGNYPSDPSFAVRDSMNNLQIGHEFIDKRMRGKYGREGYVNGSTPYDSAFKTVLKNSWIKLEYLNWEIQDLGDTSMGAPTTITTGDPASAFEYGPPALNDPTANEPDIVVMSSVPNAAFRMPNNNGFQGSLGVVTTFGEIEASAFVLTHAHDDMNFTHFIRTDTVSDPEVPLRVITQTFLLDGSTVVNDFPLEPGDPPPFIQGLIYNRAYKASFYSQVFGADANIHFDIRKVDLGLNHDVSVGFRYFQLTERLQQYGRSENLQSLAPFDTQYSYEIDSWARNNVYGPQVGYRTKFKHQYFEVGFENYVMLGLNDIETRLDDIMYNRLDNNGVAAADYSTKRKNSTQSFAAAFEFKAYGNVKMTENFWINVGYNFVVLSHITRPDDNILYNSTTDVDNNFVPNLGMRMNKSEMYVHGLTVGAEVRF